MRAVMRGHVGVQGGARGGGSKIFPLHRLFVFSRESRLFGHTDITCLMFSPFLPLSSHRSRHEGWSPSGVGPRDVLYGSLYRVIASTRTGRTSGLYEWSYHLRLAEAVKAFTDNRYTAVSTRKQAVVSADRQADKH